MHIDWWTLALQTVNVLVLIWILARFFFRPVTDIVARRQAEAQRLLSDAAAARQEAAALRAETEKARAEIGAERDRLTTEARKAARIEKENLLAQASHEIAKHRGEADEAIARDRAAAEQAVIAHASELAMEIAQRLLARLPPQVALSIFLDGLCQKVRASRPDGREGPRSFPAADDKIEVVTAAALSDQETEHVRSALEDAFGRTAAFAFRSDPTLLAGIELHGRNTTVRNSWRADLDRIREDLNRDGRAGQS